MNFNKSKKNTISSFCEKSENSKTKIIIKIHTEKLLTMELCTEGRFQKLIGMLHPNYELPDRRIISNITKIEKAIILLKNIYYFFFIVVFWLSKTKHFTFLKKSIILISPYLLNVTVV